MHWMLVKRVRSATRKNLMNPEFSETHESLERDFGETCIWRNANVAKHKICEAWICRKLILWNAWVWWNANRKCLNVGLVIYNCSNDSSHAATAVLWMHQGVRLLQIASHIEGGLKCICSIEPHGHYVEVPWIEKCSKRQDAAAAMQSQPNSSVCRFWHPCMRKP